MRFFSRFFSAGMSRSAQFGCIAMLAGCAILSSCAKEDPATDVNLTPITFPNGKKVVAETVRQEFELMRGLMYRDSLPADRGMLFVYGKQEKHSYWMYQTKIPLDMIWLDHQHNIVEIVANTQPCTTVASECPKYGGNLPATFVLELNAGVAAKNSLHEGDFLDF
jgi:uncharacterized membrane protein (UPF0127 family)